MFKLYFTNIPDRGLVGEFNTIDAAKAAGRAFGFEFTVMLGNTVIGAWSVFGGWRVF